MLIVSAIITYFPFERPNFKTSAKCPSFLLKKPYVRLLYPTNAAFNCTKKMHTRAQKKSIFPNMPISFTSIKLHLGSYYKVFQKKKFTFCIK